jgi:spermidine synthase
VGAALEELAASETPMGLLTLRRRLEPSLGVDVFEVKLGDEYLMSSQFTTAEIELARLGLAEIVGTELDVVVGGLGLGYTAMAALRDPRVRSLVIVETLGEVIDWHRDGLLADVAELTSDPRTRLVHGDFFALAGTLAGFDPETPGQRYHAILVDIDHSPRHVLSERHRPFYAVDGLRELTRHLHPGGVFALWSNDPPDDAFGRDLAEVFTSVEAHEVTFRNHYTRGESANTVYVAS